MSEINNQEPIFMEKEEYMEYLRNQVKADPEIAKQPIAQINMYDMNKDLVKGLKKMNNMAINKALEKVIDWYDESHLFYALLNHEKHYFTIFHRNMDSTAPDAAKSFVEQVKDIITNYYGDNDIRAIDVDSNGAIEIWGMWDGEPTVAYLFPYDEGVVYY